MSVLINGMKMPSVCDECWALDESGDYPICRITDETRGYNFRAREKRMDRCPLIELPDHGRLVDADEMERMFLKATGISISFNGVPTVIPAERSEE